MLVRLAHFADYTAIVNLIDKDFTRQGYGFVNREQIFTEIKKHRVIVAESEDNIVGVRIGMGTIWNLVVANDVRGQSIGTSLIAYHRPHTIRVKSDPIGHLSNSQKDGFVDPTPFYEKLGFKLWGLSFPKNFWQKGENGEGQFHIKGDRAHIKIYRDMNVTLFE